MIRFAVVACILSCVGSESSEKVGKTVIQIPGYQAIVEEAYTFASFGKSYVIFKTLKLNWMRAHLKCKEHGMRLLTFEGGLTEIEFIKPLLQQHIVAGDGQSRPIAWVGITDLFNEGNFTAIESGKPFPHSYFGTSQPDNYGNREHCVEFRQFEPNSELVINDFVCDVASGVACEYRHSCECNKTCC